MTILITLTTVGADCSTFDIYSNVDGFISAFETDVPKASLSSGFSSANVPDGTTVIRVKAKGVCTNYIDINLSSITTTTTSTTIPPISPTAKVSQDALGNILDDIHSNSTTWSLYGTSFTAYNGATILSANWQIMNISTTSGWIDQGVATEDIEKIWVLNEFNYGFRIKVVDSNGLEGHSNILNKYYVLPLNSFTVDFYNDVTSACSATSGNRIQEFTTITPIEGDICYKYNSTPYTGSFSYIKIFNYGNVTGNNVVFAINGSTGVLGAINEC